MAAGGTSLRYRRDSWQPPPLALAAPAVTPRMRTAATWLLVLPLLAEGVLPGVVKLEVAGLAVLAFAAVTSGRELPRRAAERVLGVAAVLTLTVAGYAALGAWPQGAGTLRAYDGHAVLWAVTYAAVAAFAVLFWDRDLFARVMWKACTVALWVGVATCLASRITGHEWLVNPAHGTLRMTGTLTEPSDWAPVLCVVLLLALRRRSWLHAALALAGLVLADSPTCLLVTAVTVPLYLALTSSRRHRVPVLAGLAVLIAAGTVLASRADIPAWEASPNSAEAAAGRLLSGVQAAATDGQQGANSRFSTTTAVLEASRDGGWVRTGAGPAADAVYFPAEHPPGTPLVAPNALWVSVWFDFGEWGVAVLAVLMGAAAWRMRRDPLVCAVLLPFFAASLVNSSVPDYSLVALGIFLYAFGWARRSAASQDV